ncbi:hypothetical protein EDC56_3903 [Sinobacterium caligoides]|uniref:Uncharacterized protein n=1 Tax=Sinobacterium caligoides TaxID=933926 RepID=A0A3N2D4R1_9GAMM|nr:hypothetical protein [Sinobacterium caligoides]ROR94760.1 hypothetical protein EDC56_3903 [Sinobacterium caligoides]
MPRKDLDDLNDIPSLIPERDESRANSTGHKPRATAHSHAPAPAATAQKQGSSFWTVAALLALLLALLAGGASYYLYQQLQLTKQGLEQADTRLGALEARLSSSDESMNESSQTMSLKIKEMGKKVDEHYSQIDKLWAARNALLKTSKASNGQLSTQAAALKTLQKELNTKMAALKVATAKSDSNSSKLKSLADQGLATNLSVDTLEQTVEEQQRQLRQLVDAGNKLKHSGGSTEQQLKDLSEWVDSFNGYRKQVNQRLSALEKG